MLFFLGQIDKVLPKPRFSKPIFGHSAGSSKLDRPYCKQFRSSVGISNRLLTLALPECTKIAHRRSLAIFTADQGIAGNSAARITFTRFHRRTNRGVRYPEGPAIEKIQSRSKISIPARKFQSRSKCSISIENFNPRVYIYVSLVVYREGLDRKF